MNRIGPGAITLGVCAIIFGLVAAYAAKQYLTTKPSVKDLGEPMLVAKWNLPVNTRITPNEVEIVKRPATQIPKGALTSEGRGMQRVTKEVILAGQPIMDANLHEVGYTPTLESRLPPGMSAVAFEVEPNNALAGVIGPDAIVDVVFTAKADKRDYPSLQGITTKTIVEKVKVLATNAGLFKDIERVNPSLRSVTVAATPEVANLIILAKQFGTLSVTLRSPDDDSLPRKQSLVTPEDFFGPRPIPQPKPPERLLKVQAWRGGRMTEIQFKDERVQGEKVMMDDSAPADQSPAPARAVTAGYHPSDADEKGRSARDRGE